MLFIFLHNVDLNYKKTSVLLFETFIYVFHFIYISYFAPIIDRNEDKTNKILCYRYSERFLHGRPVM